MLCMTLSSGHWLRVIGGAQASETGLWIPPETEVLSISVAKGSPGTSLF